MVNQSGERFIGEMKTRDVVSEAINAEEGGNAYIIGNAIADIIVFGRQAGIQVASQVK